MSINYRNEQNSDETTKYLLLDYLNKLIKSEEIEENKDIQLICCTISGRSILSNFLCTFPVQNFSETENYKNINKTYELTERNLLILSNIISASLMNINQNMEEINFENTKNLTLLMFKFYM